MPRLTNAQYLYQRHRLRVSWQHRKAEPFAALSATEQLRLWVYFAPTQDLTDAEAVAHRKEISGLYASLPQQAGRAYKRVFPYLDPERSGPVLPERRTSKPRGPVVVHAVPRDEIDAHKLARVVVNFIDASRKEQDRENAAA